MNYPADRLKFLEVPDGSTSNLSSSSDFSPWSIYKQKSPISAEPCEGYQEQFSTCPQIIAITPAESAADVWSEKWTDLAYDRDRNNLQFDLNYKIDKLVSLKRRIADYKLDPPLTVIGYATAKRLGENLTTALNGEGRVGMWVSSPELRCMQTLVAMFEGTHWKSKTRGIYVQKALCSYYGGSSRNIPHFVTREKLISSSKHSMTDDSISSTSALKINWNHYESRSANPWDPADLVERGIEKEDEYKDRFKIASTGVVNETVRRVKKRLGQQNITVVCLPMLNHLPFLAVAMGVPHPENSVVSAYFKTLPNLAVAQLYYNAKKNHFKMGEPVIKQFKCADRLPMSTFAGERRR